MRIVVYADFLSAEHHTVTQAFFRDLVVETARQHTGDTFILLARTPVYNKGTFPANITIRPIRKLPGKNRVVQWMNKFLLYGLLQKLKADLFVSASKHYAVSYTFPYVFLLLEPVVQPSGSYKIPLYARQPEDWIGANKQLYTALKGATATIVFSQNDAQLLQHKLGIPASKLKVIPMDCLEETGILEWEEKEHVKNKHTLGAEYFIYAGDIHQRFDLLDLLKAFSLFKKWQQSGMQLVIAGSTTSWTREFIQKLATFKYRKEVHLITNPSKELLRQLIAAAYAFVYPTSHDHFPLPILSAMRSGVPVITFLSPVVMEIAGNTVVYGQPGAEGLSASMQAIYKDEASRSSYIHSALLYVSKGNKAHILAEFYDILQNSLPSKS